VRFGQHFELEVPLSTDGAKLHKFDLVSADRLIVAECKAFCWTRPDFGIPVAKITTLKETVHYLRGAQAARKRLLIVQEDIRPRTSYS
jgi:hypothetical protein